MWLLGLRGPFAESLEEAGVKVFSDRNLASDLRRKLGEDRDVIVHSYLHAAHLLDAAVAWGAGARYIKSTRNQGRWYDRSLRQRAKLALRRQMIRFHLVNSRDVKDSLVMAEGVAPDSITVIHNGLRDISAMGPYLSRADLLLEKDDLVFTVVSRLRRFKNIGFLIRAMRVVHRKSPRARLLIVGDGPDRKELESLAREAVPHGVVRFLGFHPAPQAIVRLSDVFVSASLSEGMSNALIEAAMTGTPALASSRAAGSREVVSEGDTGLLHDPEKPEQFIAAATRLISDPGLRQRMGRSARARYEALVTFDRQVDMFDHYYRYVNAPSVVPRPLLSEEVDAALRG